MESLINYLDMYQDGRRDMIAVQMHFHQRRIGDARQIQHHNINKQTHHCPLVSYIMY